MIRRVIGAALLNSKVYEEVEHDAAHERQAYAVVLGAAALFAIGVGIDQYQKAGGFEGATILKFLYALGATFVMYFIWAGVAYYLGTGFFGGKADPGELRRTIGFAHGPQALGLLVFVNPYFWSIGVLWSLVCGFVATRQALDVSNGKTFVVLLLSGGIVVMVGFFLLGFLGLWIVPAGINAAP